MLSRRRPHLNYYCTKSVLLKVVVHRSWDIQLVFLYFLNADDADILTPQGAFYCDVLSNNAIKPSKLHPSLWRYSPCRAWACLTTSFHSVLTNAFLLQHWMSSCRRVSTSSINLSLGLPLSRFPLGLYPLYSSVLVPCPAQSALLYFCNYRGILV